MMAETFGAHRAWEQRFSDGVFAAMNPKNRNALAQRVVNAAEAALAAQGYASSIDVLVGMKLFRSWAARRGLSASPTSYVARSPQRQTLRFSRSGDPTIEALYRTHWVSQQLSERKRQRLAEKASRAPDLVVVQPLNMEWKCHRCGKTGDLLMMENPGPACLVCVGLDDLEFLPAGDALLSRRAKAKSTRCAVVVRFSRTRRRYERQGLLVEPSALADASGLSSIGQFHLTDGVE